MSGGAYVLGVGLLLVLTVATATAAVEIRRAVLPRWTGSPARVAEATAGIGVLMLTSELLGSVGLFRRWPLVAVSVVVAAAASLLRRRAGARRTTFDAHEPPEPGPTPPLAVGVAVIAVGAALTRSTQAAHDALHGGILSFDSLWYHLPFAARFVQSGSVTGLQDVGNAATSFYPANGELVHAVGMLLFGSDLLSPLVNVAWLGLALAAGWCVGRPYGAAPATMLATCLAAFLPVMGGAQAGTAGTDVAVLALLVSAVALLVNGLRSAAALGAAGLAAGLAAGTKLDAWSTAIALGVVATALASSRARTATAMRWTGGVAVGSLFWYGRNLAAVGNPVPWFGLQVGGLVSLPSTPPPVDCGRTSVAHYLLDPGFLSAHLLPQLPGALGARWWLVLGLAAVGAGAALLSSQVLLRGLGVVALVSSAAYLVTPATAGGNDARCFAFNTRFATPALALGLILLALTTARARSGPFLSVLALAATLVLTVTPSHDVVALVTALVLIAAASSIGAGLGRFLPRRADVAVAAGLAVVAFVVGWNARSVYARTRYTDATFSDPVAPIAARLQGVHDARIAVTGLSESYPLYGADLSNRVAYPARRDGARFEPYATCSGWLLALRRGHYDYVVTANEGAAPAPEAAWTRRYPGARELLVSAPRAASRGAPWSWQLFALDPGRSVDASSACG